MLSEKKKHPLAMSLYVSNLAIEAASHTKYLSVNLSSDLSWSNHIPELCSQAKLIPTKFLIQTLLPGELHLPKPPISGRFFSYPELLYFIILSLSTNFNVFRRSLPR